MTVLEKSIMLDGTKIQIEDWNEEYSFMAYGSTIGAYPLSKQSMTGQFSPKLNKSYRFGFRFKDQEETRVVFEKLKEGSFQLSDIAENYTGKKEYINCF